MLRLTDNDKELILSCIRMPVSFTYGHPTCDGRPGKLLRSSLDQARIPRLSTLALAGLLAQRWDMDDARNERTLSFSTTALGRDAIEYHAPILPPVHRSIPKSNAELLAEASERD